MYIAPVPIQHYVSQQNAYRRTENLAIKTWPIVCMEFKRHHLSEATFKVFAGYIGLCSLVPRLSNLFNVPREKRGSLVKLITCMTSGGTNIHIRYNSELAGLRHRISHQKFDLKVTISYESASGGPSIPSLGVENCDLHGNSIVPSSKSVPPGPHGHNWITLQITVFEACSEGAESAPVPDS